MSFLTVSCVLLINNVCIVEPTVKEVACKLNGDLVCKTKDSFGNSYEKHNKYEKVVFTSKVKIKLSSFIDSKVEGVFFMKGIETLDIDVDVNNNKLPTFYLNKFADQEIIKQMEDNNIPYNEEFCF